MTDTQTQQDIELGHAAREFAAAADAVEQHDGPKTGPEFEAKVDAWRKAYDALRRLAGGAA